MPLRSKQLWSQVLSGINKAVAHEHPKQGWKHIACHISFDPSCFGPALKTNEIVACVMFKT